MNSPDDDPPPPPVPPRDPLLDDPLFAEIVGPGAPKPAEPVYAEPVEAAEASELPVAELAPVVRPKAQPAPPAAAPKFGMGKPLPTTPTTEQPRPQWFAACGVIGCLGVLVIAAVTALLWIAITLLSGLGDKFGDTKPTVSDSKNRTKIGPVAPTVLVDDINVPLSGIVDAVGYGGNGRFLLMRIPSKQEVHVFDPNLAEVVVRIPIGEPKAQFAAGASKLFVYKPVANKIARFDLTTGQLEAEAAVSSKIGAINALAIGPGSEGPLYAIAGAGEARLAIYSLDASSLEPLASHIDSTYHVRADRVVHARASIDGSALGLACKEGAVAVQFPGGKANPTLRLLKGKGGTAPAWCTPSPDGKYYYTPRGVFLADGSSFLRTGYAFFSFPTAHGSEYYLTLDVDADRVNGFAQLHLEGDTDREPKLGALTKGELVGEFAANQLGELSLTADERVHLWPGAGLLAVLPSSSQQLQLYKVQIPKK